MNPGKTKNVSFDGFGKQIQWNGNWNRRYVGAGIRMGNL